MVLSSSERMSLHQLLLIEGRDANKFTLNKTVINLLILSPNFLAEAESVSRNYSFVMRHLKCICGLMCSSLEAWYPPCVAPSGHLHQHQFPSNCDIVSWCVCFIHLSDWRRSPSRWTLPAKVSPRLWCQPRPSTGLLHLLPRRPRALSYRITILPTPSTAVHGVGSWRGATP